MSLRRLTRVLLVLPVLLSLAAKPAPTKPPAPAASPAPSPADPPHYAELDPDLMVFKIRLYRYLNYCDVMRDMRAQLPPSKVLDAPPLEGLGTFNSDELWRQMKAGKKTKPQLLKEWSDEIDKRLAEHRNATGPDGLGKVEKSVQSPTSQISLFIEWMTNQTLSQIKLSPTEGKAALAAARKSADRYFARRDRYRAALFEANAKHIAPPADPFDPAAMEEWRSTYWTAVLGNLPPGAQAEMQKSWALLYPNGPAAPPITPTVQSGHGTTPGTQPAASPAVAIQQPEVTGPQATPVTKPDMVEAPAFKPVTPALASGLVGIWTTSKDGMEERWTIRHATDGWHVSCIYFKAGKEVGSCHGDNVKYSDGEIDFTRVFDKRPKDDMPDHSASRIALRNGKADLVVSAGGGKSFKKVLDRTGG